MALPRPLLPAPPALCHSQEVHGGFRNVGNATARHHAGERCRAAESVLRKSFLGQGVSQRRPLKSVSPREGNVDSALQKTCLCVSSRSVTRVVLRERFIWYIDRSAASSRESTSVPSSGYRACPMHAV